MLVSYVILASHSFSGLIVFSDAFKQQIVWRQRNDKLRRMWPIAWFLYPALVVEGLGMDTKSESLPREGYHVARLS
jgi:hypothetical protein